MALNKCCCCEETKECVRVLCPMGRLKGDPRTVDICAVCLENDAQKMYDPGDWGIGPIRMRSYLGACDRVMQKAKIEPSKLLELERYERPELKLSDEDIKAIQRPLAK